MIPNLLVPGVVETIRRSKARKVYICNVMTQNGETDGYSAADHIQAILDHCGDKLVDEIIVHGAPIAPQLQARYEQEGAEPVAVDVSRISSMGVSIVLDHFVIERENMLRHDATKVSKAILRM